MMNKLKIGSICEWNGIVGVVIYFWNKFAVMTDIGTMPIVIVDTEVLKIIHE